MKMTVSLFAACGLMLLISCQKNEGPLTEEQKSQIADSTKQVVEQYFGYVSKLDFASAFALCADNADARYVENGAIFPSLEELKATYAQLKLALEPIVEVTENKVDKWNILVLSNDAVLMTLPVNFKMKYKGRPEYNGHYVWSSALQRLNGKWTIIQTHESFTNYPEFIAGITPPQLAETE